MVAVQVVAGLANTEYQGKVLAKANTVTMLGQKFKMSVSLETTDSKLTTRKAM